MLLHSLDTIWLSTATIIGIVIGGVIFITVVVGVIIALVCGCTRSMVQGGNIVNPAPSAPGRPRQLSVPPNMFNTGLFLRPYLVRSHQIANVTVKYFIRVAG